MEGLGDLGLGKFGCRFILTRVLSMQGPVLQNAVEETVRELSVQFNALHSSLKKPNILILGRTGSGKSRWVVGTVLWREEAPLKSDFHPPHEYIYIYTRIVVNGQPM